MKNICRLFIIALLLGISEKLAAQEQPAVAEAQEKCVQTILRGKVNYPALARLAKIEGKVLCKVQLDEEGHVLKAELLKKGNPILDEEALRVLKSETEFKAECPQKEVVVSVVFRLQ